MAIYGHEYKKGGKLGRNNVTMLIQGKVDVKQKGTEGDVYELTGDIVHYNGEHMTAGYVPFFAVRYSSDRKNFGIKGARVSITTKDGRKINKTI